MFLIYSSFIGILFLAIQAMDIPKGNVMYLDKKGEGGKKNKIACRHNIKVRFQKFIS